MKDTNIRGMKISKYFISRNRFSNLVSMICETENPAFCPFKSDIFCLPWRWALQSAFGGTSSLTSGNSTLIQSRKITNSFARGWQMVAPAALSAQRMLAMKEKAARTEKMRGSPELQKDTQETPSLRK